MSLWERFILLGYKIKSDEQIAKEQETGGKLTFGDIMPGNLAKIMEARYKNSEGAGF